MRVPGYAQRTGRRLLFQPLALQRGDPPLFSSSERRYPIVFPYPYKESDNVAIRLPPDMELDHAEAPGDVTAQDFLAYKLRMGVQNGQFVAARDLVLGSGGVIALPAESYSQLKSLFDAIHQRGNHVISLKQKGSPETSQAGK